MSARGHACKLNTFTDAHCTDGNCDGFACWWRVGVVGREAATEEERQAREEEIAEEEK